jgi:biopolymer transport protein ExbD/biopolymer transport protein TolR
MAVTTRDGKTQTALAEINMIPFIDIMLVLLIIFMITAPVIQSGIEVDVPETEIVNELIEDLLVVTITQDEALWLQSASVNINEMAERIREKLSGAKRQSVYVRSDRRVPWEIITKVLESLKDGGINNIVIVTQPLAEARSRR